jgi:hypothetical protein
MYLSQLNVTHTFYLRFNLENPINKSEKKQNQPPLSVLLANEEWFSGFKCWEIGAIEIYFVQNRFFVECAT